jgi:hypothetical protein
LPPRATPIRRAAAIDYADDIADDIDYAIDVDSFRWLFSLIDISHIIDAAIISIRLADIDIAERIAADITPLRHWLAAGW